MPIGDSKGAFHADDFFHEAAPWVDNMDMDPEVNDLHTGDNNEIRAPISKLNDDFVTPIADKYDTPLSAEEQTAYGSKFSPEDSTDYDMQGFYKANPDVDPHTDGTHYPDTFKKPNHPTFSDESVYNGKDGNEGGKWGTTSDGHDTFTPGPTNIKTHGLLGLIDYFDKTEPNAQLLLPKK